MGETLLRLLIIRFTRCDWVNFFLRTEQSWGKLRWEPATRWFDDSFDAIRKSDERFARQYRCGLPPGFPLALASSRIDHHLSGLNKSTLTLAFIGSVRVTILKAHPLKKNPKKLLF